MVEACILPSEREVMRNIGFTCMVVNGAGRVISAYHTEKAANFYATKINARIARISSLDALRVEPI